MPPTRRSCRFETSQRVSRYARPVGHLRAVKLCSFRQAVRCAPIRSAPSRVLTGTGRRAMAITILLMTAMIVNIPLNDDRGRH
jgi:hypothetical protein